MPTFNFFVQDSICMKMLSQIFFLWSSLLTKTTHGQGCASFKSIFAKLSFGASVSVSQTQILAGPIVVNKREMSQRKMTYRTTMPERLLKLPQFIAIRAVILLTFWPFWEERRFVCCVFGKSSSELQLRKKTIENSPKEGEFKGYFAIEGKPKTNATLITLFCEQV